MVSILTKGCINVLKSAASFYKAIRGADILLHAPGGPSIGDIYFQQEKQKLRRLMCVRNIGVPYAFYAPSMGSFKDGEGNSTRKKILGSASLLCLHEEISQDLVKEFVPTVRPILTLDSAFQHSINIKNKAKLNAYQKDAFKKEASKMTELVCELIEKNACRSGVDVGGDVEKS